MAPSLAARLLERLFLTPRRWQRPVRETQWMSSARRSTLDFGGRRKLRLLTWGEGPTVLLAHGWSGRGSQMGCFAEPLVDAGYRVVAFDAPGHGDAGAGLSGLPEMALALAQVADHVGPVHAVVAHSLGTAATSLALSRGLDVQRLVYIAPPMEPGEYLRRAAGFLGFSEDVARMARVRIERRFAASFSDASGAALAPTMTSRLLVVHDSEDREVPCVEGARLCAAWPGAALVTTSGLGHSRILRDREVVELIVGVIGIREERTWDQLCVGAIQHH